MITLVLTNCEAASINSFLNLIEERKREESLYKKISINAFSIAKDSGFSYKGVKKSLRNLDTKLKEKYAGK